MKWKVRWRRWFAAGAAALALVLGGCSKEAPSVTEPQEQVTYTKPQIMIIAATERNRYQQVYTDKIWDAVMENGETFEEYLLEQVRVFMENLKTMTLLARDRGKTRVLLGSVRSGQTVGIFIGPEGGFDEAEVEQAVAAGAVPVTLGRRILRTETAGMVALSMLTLLLED